MSEAIAPPPPLTGFDLWTPNDYSNFITICAAAVGSTLGGPSDNRGILEMTALTCDC
eukprot:COSAG03_NODE_27045_length_255_cov_1.211538_2_plen_56_part_01